MIAAWILAAVMAGDSALKDAEPVDVHFLDLQHGFLEANIGTTARLLRTVDGGKSWKTVAPLPAADAYLRFADLRNGWMLGRDLRSTHDGGKTWVLDSGIESVLALEPNGKTVWAIVIDWTGRRALWESPVDTSRWKPAAVQPPFRPGDWALLAITGKGRALILTSQFQASSGGTLNSAVLTSDGGRTWSAAPDPCAGFDDPPLYPQLLATRPLHPDRVVVLCIEREGYFPRAALVQSSDGGASWDEKVRTGWYRGPSDLAVNEAGRIWVTVRDEAFVSDDGGRTENPTLENVNSLGPIRFVDDLHGFTFGDVRSEDGRDESRPSLLATADGGKTWTPHPIAP